MDRDRNAVNKVAGVVNCEYQLEEKVEDVGMDQEAIGRIKGHVKMHSAKDKSEVHKGGNSRRDRPLRKMRVA